MKRVTIGRPGAEIEIALPEELATRLLPFLYCVAAEAQEPKHRVEVVAAAEERYALHVDGALRDSDLNRGAVLEALLTLAGEAARDDAGVPIQAAAVGWGDKAILIAGAPGCGKSSLAAWLVERGLAYLSDDLVVLDDDQGGIAGFPAPLTLTPLAVGEIAAFETFKSTLSLRSTGKTIIIRPEPNWLLPDSRAVCGLVVIPHFVADAPLEIEVAEPARVASELAGASRRPIAAGGEESARITALAEGVPALSVRYGSFSQLADVLDPLAQFVLENELDAGRVGRFLSGLSQPPQSTAAPVQQTFAVPEATVRRANPRFTIGMATYDDYDGVYFSIQAIRLYHPEIVDQIELVVVDNHPDGPCSAALKDLDRHIPNYRYLPFGAASGTAAARDRIFQEAAGAFVLCMDCHVFVVPGALARLFDHFAADPETRDLFQGPLLYDRLDDGVSTHFDPVWRGGMYGVWANDPAGNDPEAPPFDITMQGLGLFACRRDAWPGFNPLFRGFGGEEGYIHEKVRQAGGRTLCLPFLRWLHRFNRPMGVPYANIWEDRFRNYLIGFDELGLPTAEMEAHMRELLGVEVAESMLEALRSEIEGMLHPVGQ